MPKYVALFFASGGNILAIVLNYFLGFWLYQKTKNNLKASKIGSKSLLYGEKYGLFILFFSWLPIIGDPITLVAGILRMNFIVFIFLAGLLRISRYYFILSIV